MNSKIKYTKELLESIVKDSISVADVMRKLGLKQAGGTHSHLTRKIEKYEIDTSHFLGSRANSGSRHVGGYERLSTESILVFDRCDGRRDKSLNLKKALIDSGIEEKCELCELPPIWNGKPITLQVDHRDGNGLNNLKENLRFLCPNCHSQTENYGSKNMKSANE